MVTLATVSTNRQPYTVAVWRRWDGEFVRIVTNINSRKYKNIQANPKVSVIAIDPKNLYRFLGLNGVVEDIISDREESLAELNLHSKLFTGKDNYYVTAEEEANHASVVLKIRPARFILQPKVETI